MAKEGKVSGYTKAEVVALIAAHAALPSAHHARYTDAEALAAALLKIGCLTRDVVNKSGGSLAEGDVVIWDANNDNAVTTTTAQGSEWFAGVVLVGGAADATITIITHGYCAKVLTDLSEDSGRGLFLRTVTVAKKAEGILYSSTGVFGVILTNADASGYVSSVIGSQAENY